MARGARRFRFFAGIFWTIYDNPHATVSKSDPILVMEYDIGMEYQVHGMTALEKALREAKDSCDRVTRFRAHGRRFRIMTGLDGLEIHNFGVNCDESVKLKDEEVDLLLEALQAFSFYGSHVPYYNSSEKHVGRLIEERADLELEIEKLKETVVRQANQLTELCREE